MIRQPAQRLACLAALLLTALPAPAFAQSQPSDDARRFLVYPSNKIQSFQENDGFFYLHYYGLQLDKGRDAKGNPLFYNQVIQVTRFANDDDATAACKASLAAPVPGKTVRSVPGFPCAFVQEMTSGAGDRVTVYRSSWYAQGRYFASLGETAEPRSMLPATPPVGPLLAVLGGPRPAVPSAELQVTVAPAASGAEGATVTVRIDGSTIYVTDQGGNQRLLTLVAPKKAEMPAFSPPTVGSEAKALERYVMRHVFEASYGHLEPGLRETFVSGLPMPSEVIGEGAAAAAAATAAAAQATVEAGQSAVNWVRNNPADASLLGLSVAVGLMFPVSAFANPAVATGGAALVRGVVGGAMVAGTTGFVSSLSGSFLSDKSSMQRVREAAARGAGDAAASVPGSLAGAAFEKVAGQVVAKAAVTGGSIVVGVATDKLVEKAQVSQAIANDALQAPSFAGSLVQPPARQPATGGIDFTFDR